MGMRDALGPVFRLEFVAMPRRWQIYAGRAFFVALLLGGMWLIWAPSDQYFVSHQQLAGVGRQFFSTLILTQIAVIMLAAPAATAGAICVDKGRGTLHHVFVTDLSDREIVLGKLGARLLSILTLLACGIPVMALGGLLGGVDYGAILRAFFVAAGVAVVACSLAMIFSVWVRKPQHALLATYAVLAIWVLIYPVGFYFLGAPFRARMMAAGFTTGMDTLWFLHATNPFLHALEPIWPSDLEGWWWAFTPLFVAGMLAVSGVMAAIAVGRLRPVVIGQADRKIKRERADAPLRLLDYLPGPPLDGNPVLWREWHRKKPTKWAGRFWLIYGILSTAASLFVIAIYFNEPRATASVDLAARVNGFGVAVGLLLLTISATTSLAEERDRGSLDVIMTTPLSTATILWGKWWGTFAMVPRLAILPAWVCGGLALVSGNWLAPFAMLALILAYAAFITSLGLALATWIPKLGRAIGAGLFIYIMLSVGLYFAHGIYMSLASPPPVPQQVLLQTNGVYRYVTLMLPSPNPLVRPDGDWLYLGIPLVGVMETTAWAGRLPYLPNMSNWGRNPVVYEFGNNEGYGWALVWVGIYVGISALLITATIASFDRLLGRVSLSPRVVARKTRRRQRAGTVTQAGPIPG